MPRVRSDQKRVVAAGGLEASTAAPDPAVAVAWSPIVPPLSLIRNQADTTPATGSRITSARASRRRNFRRRRSLRLDPPWSGLGLIIRGPNRPENTEPQDRQQHERHHYQHIHT